MGVTLELQNESMIRCVPARARLIGAALLILSTTACAPLLAPEARVTMLKSNALDTSDPWEKSNRAQFALNKAINDAIISPAARTYRAILPQPLRDRIETGANNLDEPRIFGNNLLQGRFDAAQKTLGRFLVNSTIGIAGIFDVASLGGLERQTGDFGQTLFSWGVPSGPYWVMPVFGPANVRDGFGRAVDIGADPVSWTLPIPVGQIPFTAVSFGAGLGQIELLDDLEQGAVDPYIRFRSTYLQNRAGELGQAAGFNITPETVEAPQPTEVKTEKKPAKRKR